MTNVTVSIIGSFRQHYKQVVSAAREFQRAGARVISPPLSEIINPGDNFTRFQSDHSQSSDHDIQAETFRKIFISDLVYAVIPNGYIGRTTSYELGRIHERGIPVYFSDVPLDLPIQIPESCILQPYQILQKMLRHIDLIEGD